jgi:hypothetical protein
MTIDVANLPVRHNEAAHRFEADVTGGLARADYRLHGKTLDLVHTEVPESSENRGVAARVVQTALDYARAHALKVQAICPYVRAYMRKHPEMQDLLADGTAV